jgi:N-acetyl-anhydromuramyl-L-alanine amidase AmpD
MKRIQHDFPTDQYYAELTVKKAVCLHHTVSGPGVIGDITWWNKTPERIATHYIIDREGTVHQCIDEKYWAHHLGIKAETFASMGIPANNTGLNKQTIGIELDSWGWLKEVGENVYQTSLGTAFTGEVEQYDPLFRNKMYYEKYTDAQLDSLWTLLLEITARHEIPTGYNEAMWQLSKQALNGAPGIWSHTSYRPDKTDCHPQPELIDLLKSIC